MCLPKETVTAIMMLDKNTKAIVCLLDGETDFFNIIAEDTLVPYSFITLINMIFGTKKQNMFLNYFGGANSENNLSFSWLVTVFAVL